MDSVKVTRVEVIGHDGREFSKMLKDSHYEVAIQDDGIGIYYNKNKVELLEVNAEEEFSIVKR